MHDNSGAMDDGKRYDGDNDDDCLASAPNGSYNGKRQRYDGMTGTTRDNNDTTRDNNDTTVRTDSDRGQQLQDDTHNDEDYRVCVRIHTPRDHDG